MNKNDFPIFDTHKELVYLDSCSSSQKPQQVIDAVAGFYTSTNANVHRGIYRLSEDASALYEGTRDKVCAFLNAKSTKEVIFTSGTTEAINLVASSNCQLATGKNKKVLITSAEHHANIVPWQLFGYQLLVANYDSNFRINLEDYKKKLSKGIDLVAINHVSNVLGTINPVKELIQLAHEAGAKVLIDGAQAVPHIPIDVQDLDTDFYVFSSHKMCGPTGVGVLYAKEELLKGMQPVQGGGDMIRSVSFEKFEWNDLPWKFEAGTPNIAGVVGLGSAIEYINSLRQSNILSRHPSEDGDLNTVMATDPIWTHEQELGEYALEKLQEVESLTLYGPKNMKDRIAVFSFTLDGIHPHDIASILDEEHIAVRAGHHCAMPLHEEIFKKPATARASFYLYNEKEDVDKLVKGLEKVVTLFK